MRAPSLEVLEPRIAPARITIKGNVATWLDWDGDTVSLKWAGPTAPDFTSHAPDPMQPDRLLIDEVRFTNRGDVITVTVSAGGDGRVDLGYINATGTPLKSFTATRASVLELDAGDGVKAIDSLVLGSYGTAKPTLFDPLNPVNGIGALNGQVLSVKIRGDIAYGGLDIGVNASTPGKSVSVGGNLQGNVPAPTASASVAGLLKLNSPFDSVSVGGSIIGGSVAQAGRLALTQAKTLTVKGSILGGTAPEAGSLAASGILGTSVVGGSVIGGSELRTGYVQLAATLSFAVGGDILGGTAQQAGYVTPGAVKKVTTVGSILGGTGRFSGCLQAVGAQDVFLIGGDIRGGSDEISGVASVGDAKSVSIRGSIVGSPTTVQSIFGGAGALTANSVKTLSIGRDLIAGGDGLLYNGAIFVGGTLGKLNIGGSVIGQPTNLALILVTGSGATGPKHAAIGQITVAGSFDHGLIDAGSFLPQSLPTQVSNPDAKILSVKIGRDFIASSIIAGVSDGGKRGVGPNGGDDTAPGSGAIGIVTIGGGIFGDPAGATGGGFEAKSIAKIVVGASPVFQTGSPAKPLDPSGNIRVVEL